MRFEDRASATLALARLKKGEDFGALARSLSKDPSAASGGDLGFVQPAEMKEPLRSVVSGLASGGLSDVVAAGGGFVIVKREK
jgi:peptidyl-prolyl cis-trans isomerase SurA